MNIIKATSDSNLFRSYLEDAKNKITLKDWRNWRVALRVLYGLPLKKKKSIELYQKCTGREALPKHGFRTALFLVGRRGGKSKIAGLIAAFEAALSGSESKLSKGEMGLISVISPSRFQSTIIQKYIRAAFCSPLLEQEIVSDKANHFILNNGVRIEILTGDWRVVRGFTQLAVVVDEICFFGLSDESKVRNDAELIQAIKPALMTTKGKLICISTKYAKRGWAYAQWRRCFGNDAARTLVWEAPSLLMNSATLCQEDIQEELDTDMISARTEFLNEWRDDISAYISREMIESCVSTGRTELMPRKFTQYYAFADVSGGRTDDAALAIGHKENSKVIIDFLKRYKSPHNPNEVISQMCVEAKRFGIKRVTGDNYSAEFVADAFRHNQIGYVRSKVVKSGLYLELLPRICSHGIELLDDPILINQLASLERKTRSGGKDVVDHPSGMHDDSANVVAGVAVVAQQKVFVVRGGFEKSKNRRYV